MSQSDFRTLALEACRQRLHPRARDAHKGDFGHILIVGGDYGMSGACRLVGEAALRSGAGLVSIATRKEQAFAMSSGCPELMCYGVKKPTDLDVLLARANVVVVGNGLGQHAWGSALWAHIVSRDLPLIVDADALNLLAKKPMSRKNWILTPHPGEAARLLNTTTADIQIDRLKAVQALQKQYEGIVVLKGHGTLVASAMNTPDLCTQGNPGMAVAGMGDVLTGVIAALVAQGLSLLDAARLGVVAHATAGDKAAVFGERGILAHDLFEGIRTCLN
ncbi:MAG TPA: NAD(P)H-hydrate dehydratase [Gammaproteobacteria bacterium]|nr:NAD(P)H-hydrate dehydratase [Gammaproteobacteria bacterium]